MLVGLDCNPIYISQKGKFNGSLSINLQTILFKILKISRFQEV